LGFAQNEIVIDPETNTIKLNMGKAQSKAVLQNRKSNYAFKYDRVLHNASQETIFHLMVEDIVRSVLEGHNGTVFAYGQTGAGKTFTMIGPTTNFKQRGISPRSISMIFQEMEKRTDTDFKVIYILICIRNRSFC
jgi:kinesin family protein 6/9